MKEKITPLWLDISKQIENDVKCGKYNINGYLPKEMELCEMYSASRITIRGALARLVDLGIITRTKGKGTVIQSKKIEEPLLKIHGFTGEMNEKGTIPSTSYAHIERKNVTGYVAELFEDTESTNFIKLERIRCINDVAIGYFVTYLAVDKGLSLNDAEYYSSLYEKLKNECEIVIDRINQTVSAEIADKKTREMLNLLSGEPVIVMKRWGYMKEKLIEYSVCKYDGKRYEYNMELGQR